MNEEEFHCVGDFRMAKLEWCTAHDNWFHGCNLQAALKAKNEEIDKLHKEYFKETLAFGNQLQEAIETKNREIDELRSRSEKLVQALEQIAGEDYRGNRSTASNTAFHALTIYHRKPEEAGKPIPAPGKE